MITNDDNTICYYFKILHLLLARLFIPGTLKNYVSIEHPRAVLHATLVAANAAVRHDSAHHGPGAHGLTPESNARLSARICPVFRPLVTQLCRLPARKHATNCATARACTLP
jgi:hypothetical protein